MEFVDHGRLADARIAGDQHQFRAAAVDDAVKGGEQGPDLALSPVEFLGNQESVWRILLAEREVVDAALGLPLSQAAAKIVLDAGRGLIAFLGGLSEQLHDYCRDRARNLL